MLIDGHGGIGKTALAIEAAHRAPSELFDRKIFISAKERELTSKGEVSSKEFSQTSFLSILNEIALQLGEEGIPRLDPEKRANALRLAIASMKTLIILDNLETLNNDDRDYVYQFLNRLPQGAKAIVTSRRRDETDARTIRLDELQEFEAEKLITELAKRNPRLQNITDTDKKELFYTASGNPLIIRWIIGQVGRSESNIKTITEAINFLRQSPKGNDPLEYVFGDLVASLTPSELNILVAMTYFNQSPKPEWIASITDYSEATIDKVWDELANRSILTVNKTSKEYFLPPLTKQFIQKTLQKERSDMEDKFVNYARQKALEFGAKNNINGLMNLENYWPLISASLPYIMRKENNELQILCDVLDTFLKSTGLRDEWLWLNTQAGLKAELNYDYDWASERSYKIGLIYSYLEKSKEVLQYALRVEMNWNEAKSEKEPNRGKILGNHLRGISYKINGDYDKATKIINEALNLAKENTRFQIPVRASLLNTLGEIQIKEGEIGNSKEKFQFAERNFEEALLIALQNDSKEDIAIYKGNLANLYLKQGQWKKAETFASDALMIVEEIGLQEEIARNNLYLAIAYLNLTSSGPRGLSASQKAVAIYRRLRHKDLSIAEAILSEWEK